MGVSLKQCLNNYAQQCQKNPAIDQKEHHLECDQRVGWKVVDGKFAGTEAAKIELCDKIFSEGFTHEEGEKLCDQVNGVLHGTFPELKEMISEQSRSQKLSQAYLVSKIFTHDPVSFITNNLKMFSKEKLILGIREGSVHSPLDAQDLARNTELLKTVEDQDVRYEILVTLVKKNKPTELLVKYYNDENGYGLDAEHYEMLNEYLK